MIGLDYAWTHPGIASIKAAGAQFVMRYLSRDASKNLSHGEAQALLAAGISVGVVWESGAQDALRDRAGGITDAREADRQAGACGLPGIPVYFALDWDATPQQQTAIGDYLDGAASVIGHGRTGVYGGYWPVSRARTAGKAAFYWGTIAWSGSNWAAAGWRPHIMQGRYATVGGVQCDWDTGLPGDIGLWPRPKPAPQPHKTPPAAPQQLQADGHQSLRQAATTYGLSPWDLILATAKAKTAAEDWGPLQHHYLMLKDWDAPMPQGMIYYVVKP